MDGAVAGAAGAGSAGGTEECTELAGMGRGRFEGRLDDPAGAEELAADTVVSGVMVGVMLAGVLLKRAGKGPPALPRGSLASLPTRKGCMTTSEWEPEGTWQP